MSTHRIYVFFLPFRFSLALLAMLSVLLFVPSGAKAASCPEAKGADKFFKTVRSKVHKKISQAQLDSYNCIFKYWSDNTLKDKRWLSYALGTAYHESHIHPVREGFGGHKKAVAAAKYAWKQGWPKRPYHVVHPKTGKVYYGRGLVQITYAENYLKVGRQIGLGDALYKNPDLALDPKIATKLMFHGMIKGSYRVEKKKSVMRKCGGPVKKYVRAKLGLYFNDKCNEWNRARNMINGDIRKNGGKVAKLAKGYLGGLKTIPAPIIEDPVDVDEPEVKPDLPGDEGEPGGTPVSDKPITPIPDEGETADKPDAPSVDKPVSDEKEIVPIKPGSGEGETEPDPGTDTPSGPDIATPVTPDSGEPTGDGGTNNLAEEKLAKLEAQGAEQAAKVSSIGTRIDSVETKLTEQGQGITNVDTKLTGQQEAVKTNEKALALANERLQSIETKLDQLTQKVEKQAPVPPDTKPETKPDTKPQSGEKPEAKPGGWFGETAKKYFGYVWNSPK